MVVPLYSVYISPPEHEGCVLVSGSELAYEAIRQCMIEDPRLLFRPLLSRFNKLYQDTSDKNSRYRQAEFIKSLVRQRVFPPSLSASFPPFFPLSIPPLSLPPFL